MSRSRIYIAGPYRGDIQANVTHAIGVSRNLYDDGYAVYCPHAETVGAAVINERRHNGLGHDDPEWLDIVMEGLPLCDGLAYFGDIERSKGTQREIKQARDQGIIARPWQEFPDEDLFYKFQREVKHDE